MTDARKLFNILIDCIYGALLSFSFVLSLVAALNFHYTYPNLIWMVGAATLAYGIAFYNKLSTKITGLVLAVFTLVGVPYAIMKGYMAKLSSDAIHTILWLNEYIGETEQLNPGYAARITIFLCLAISLFIYFFTVKRFKFFVLLIGGMGLFVAQWIMDYFMSYFSFYLYLVLIIVSYFRHVLVKHGVQRKNGYLDAPQFMLWTVPVCLAVVFFSVRMPASEKPIEWPWMDEKVATFSTYFNHGFFNQYSKFDYFSVAATGFGELDGNLGGKVRVDKTKVLTVEANRPVYLKAGSRDTYTGISWVDTFTSKIQLGEPGNILEEDIKEMKIGLKLLTEDDDLLDKYFFKDSMTVRFENLRTKSLFVPIKTERIDFYGNIPGVVAVNSNYAVTASKPLSKKSIYYIIAYDAKYGDEQFRDILRKGAGRGYYNRALTSYTNRTLRERDRLTSIIRPEDVIVPGTNIPVTYNELRKLQEKSREIYSKYLQLPESLPRRVAEYARSITSGAKNPYDMAKAIEDTLSSRYKYTLTPPATPKGQDFVDYFLFDSKEGYCTYYASAMTVLARCMGLPARYVEGYVMPSSPDNGNTYSITNEKAHAWAEVYFEGFGWVPFEPTSAYTTEFYTNASSPNTDGASASGFIEPEYDPMQDSRMLELDGLGTGETRVKKDYSSIIVTGALILLIGTLLVIAAINAIKSRLKKWRIKKMDPRESITTLYYYYIRALRLEGLAVMPGETPLQFAARVDTYKAFTAVRFKAVTEKFVVARYSNEAIAEEDKKLVYDFNKTFEERMRKDLGKIKFFLCRFILGKI